MENQADISLYLKKFVDVSDEEAKVFSDAFKEIRIKKRRFLVQPVSTDEETDAARKIFASVTLLGRTGKPEEMANAILFLASSDSSYSTGIDLVTDDSMTQI